MSYFSVLFHVLVCLTFSTQVFAESEIDKFGSLRLSCDEFGAEADTCNECFKSEIKVGHYSGLSQLFSNRSSYYQVIYLSDANRGFNVTYKIIQNGAKFAVYPDAKFDFDGYTADGIFQIDGAAKVGESKAKRGAYVYFPPNSELQPFITTKKGYGLNLMSVDASVDESKPLFNVIFDTFSYEVKGEPMSFKINTGTPKMNKSCNFFFKKIN